MNKKMVKTLKIGIVLLIIIAIIIGVIIYQSIENKKKNEITLDNLPELQYTEEQAKEFYTKTLIQYLDTFQNDFHIKCVAETTAEDGTKTVTNEEFSKKGDMVSIYYADQNDRLVIDNNYFYYIDEDEYVIAKVNKIEDINTNMDILFYSLNSINDAFVKTGNEILNDTKYYFEEYRMEKDNTVLIRYYFDEENNIKYVKAYKEDNSVQTFFEIQMLENRTYDFMFDIGDKYEMLEQDSE